MNKYKILYKGGSAEVASLLLLYKSLKGKKNVYIQVEYTEKHLADLLGPILAWSTEEQFFNWLQAELEKNYSFRSYKAEEEEEDPDTRAYLDNLYESGMMPD